MTSPLDPRTRQALEKARQELIKGKSGSFVGIEEGMDPTQLQGALDQLESIDKQLGLRPSDRQERQSEIDETTGKIRTSVDRGRAEGKAEGQRLFGDGSLGRISNDGRLARASDLAEQQATQGLTAQEEQILRERGERSISQQSLTAKRQLRALASGAGQQGETRKAREAALIREEFRAQRDLTESISLLDEEKKRTGLASFGAFGQAADTLSSGIQETNIGLGLTEREKQLQTEFASAGLEQSIESLGVQRTFQGIGLDIANENQQRAFQLQQQELNKPDPEQPDAGKGFHICTAANRYGYMSDDLYNADNWAWSLFGSAEEVAGYSLWAKPLTKNKTIIKILSPIAVAWAEHMNFLVGKSEKDNMLGWAIYAVGRPICGLIGKALDFFKGVR
jgi:hypothetical protein